MTTERIDVIKAALQAKLAPEQLEVLDDSAQHVGHPGAATGMGHFTVQIIAEAFIGKSTIERHRMVYDALGDLMKTDIHALRIFAKPPGA